MKRLSAWYKRHEPLWTFLGVVGTLGLAVAAVVIASLALAKRDGRTVAAERQELPFIDVGFFVKKERSGTTEVLAVSNYGAPLRALKIDDVVFLDLSVGKPPNDDRARVLVTGFRALGVPYFRRSGLLYTLSTAGNQTKLAALSRGLADYATQHGGGGLVREDYITVEYLDTTGNRHRECYRARGRTVAPVPYGTCRFQFARRTDPSLPPVGFAELSVQHLLDYLD